jgi:hypothetical protein
MPASSSTSQISYSVCRNLIKPDMYSVVIHQSAIIDEIFEKIAVKIAEEKANQEECFEILGMLECLFNNSAVSAAPSMNAHLPELEHREVSSI